MENGQPIPTERESAKKAVSSDDSTKSLPSESMPLGASGNLPKTTTATTLKGLRKTSKSVDFPALRSKLGLVAGALADFQAAGGIVAKKKERHVLPSGKVISAMKVFLIVEGCEVVAVQTPDGLEFDLVACS